MKARSVGLLLGLMVSLYSFAAAGGGFVYLADSVSADAGTQVVVPIRAMNFDSIISIQGTVGFDQAKLTYLGVQGLNLPSLTNANFGTSYVANGRLTFSWNENNLNPISIPDSTVMFEVVFQVTGAPGDHVSIPILNAPTLLEVVDWSFTPIPFTTRDGNVSINVPPVCEIPDSLTALNILQTQAELNWVSTNPGAAYLVEWGIWGFVPGNGIGTASGVALQGTNTVSVSNLQAGGQYEFYVRETCDTSNAVQAGPSGFATPQAPIVHATVILFGDSVQGPQAAIDTVYVRVRNFTDMVSAQGSLQWDPLVAGYLGITAIGLPSMNMGNFGLTQVNQGKLSFSWNDPNLQGVTLADSAIVFGLRMQLVGVGGAASDLAFSDLPVTIEMVDTSLTAVADSSVNGYLKVMDTTVGIPSGQHFRSLAIYPNPIRKGSGSFEIEKPGGWANVQAITLANALGQESGAVTWTEAGTRLVCTISPAIPAGVWLLAVQTAEGPIFGKLLIDRH